MRTICLLIAGVLVAAAAPLFAADTKPAAGQASGTFSSHGKAFTLTLDPGAISSGGEFTHNVLSASEAEAQKRRKVVVYGATGRPRIIPAW